MWLLPLGPRGVDGSACPDGPFTGTTRLREVPHRLGLVIRME
jgi:hypothetical protein